ncbi:MAG TPA: S8 family serine peptidase [Pyrinomonadaceae bacterium]|nr:S8 family serine peptidase [Pyrinomonadaceae bacterium]
MRFSHIVSLFAVLAALSGMTIFVQAASKNRVEGELLVKFKDGTAGGAWANSRIGAKVLEEFPEMGWQLIKLPAGVSVEQGLARYQSFGETEYAQPNYIYRVAATPNDPRFPELYAMQKISAPAAWDTTTGSASVVVAVIDTGVKYTHEDLAPNMWRNPGEIAGNSIDDDGNGFIDDVFGYDFVNNDPDPNDDYNHGTHVAGTIGAVGNNAKGVTGINWNVRMMALKIHNAQGNSTSAIVVRAFQYVRMMKLRGINIRLTNNSYGGCPEACGYDQATKDAIDAAGDADILNVFAAGNFNTNNETTPFYPSSYNSPSILAVAASDQSDNKAGFSGYGSTTVDLAAPGVGILSSVISPGDTGYGNASGTSMASPHAAGAAALLAAANPNLSAASLKATLMNRVDPLSQWASVVKSGGRLNVASAIQNQTVCNFNFAFTPEVIPVNGGGGTITVTAPQNCDFSAVSQSPWIRITSGDPGSGNTTVNFSVESNNGAPRTGAIRVAGQNFSIPQAGNNPLPLPPNPTAVLDFDGDGRTDYSVIQNSNGQMLWHNRNSANGYNSIAFGLFSDTAVPADFDGDRKWDVAVWRAGTAGSPAYFYVLNSQNNTFQAQQWGAGGDQPNITQDFDADGKADFAVARRANGQLFWYIRQSTNGALRAVQFGLASDVPLRGDFDGDARADLAVYRTASGNPANTFFVLKSSDGGLLAENFGVSSIDKIIPADFDGDRKTDFAVWRTTNGTWYWRQSSDGAFRSSQFGLGNTDMPAPGDYDGDGRTDLAVWRPNSNPNEPAIFYVNSGTAGFSAVGWGQNGMQVPANTLQISN